MVKNDISEVTNFISKISDSYRQADAKELLKIMEDTTCESAYLYGKSIVGFGRYHYKYDSGREGYSIIVGFSPRKSAFVLYGLVFYDKRTELLSKLGKYKSGKGCLYINKLSDIDTDILKKMIKNAYLEKLNNND